MASGARQQEMKVPASVLASAVSLVLGVWVGLNTGILRCSAPPAALSPALPVTAAGGKGTSILFMLASYSDAQFLSMQKVLDAVRDHCNAGYDVTVAIQATDYLTPESQRFKDIRNRMFCVRTGADIPILLDNYGQIGFGLNSKNREVIRRHIDEVRLLCIYMLHLSCSQPSNLSPQFDYFVYLEEDMVLSVSHTEANLAALRELQRRLPLTWSRYPPHLF